MEVIQDAGLWEAGRGGNSGSGQEQLAGCACLNIRRLEILVDGSESGGWTLDFGRLDGLARIRVGVEFGSLRGGRIAGSDSINFSATGFFLLRKRTVTKQSGLGKIVLTPMS